MNTLLKAMKTENSYATTENGGKSYNQVVSDNLANLQNLFALGGSYRTRSDADCVNLFMKAYNEDEAYAMKCLFYLRDIRGGAGERRFFRVIARWLANNYPEVMRRNMEHIPYYGRYDDLYCLVGTPLEKEMFEFLKHEVAEDLRLNGKRARV